LTDQLLEIGIGHSLIGLEAPSFEDHVRSLVVATLILLVFVGVLGRSGQTLLLNVIKGELAAATQATKVREEVTVDQLLF
jgi:hypothetical protein